MKKLAILIVTLGILSAMVGPANAYLDPGSTSMIWQLLLAALAGIVVFFKFFWHKLVSLFGSGNKEKNHYDK